MMTVSFHTFELSFELTDNYRNVKEALHKCGCKNYKDKREKRRVGSDQSGDQKIQSGTGLLLPAL